MGGRQSKAPIPLAKSIIGFGVVAASVVPMGVAGADDNYAPGVARLCSGGLGNVVPMPTSWDFGAAGYTIHGTNDWTANANGVSFRSCAWTGTSHSYFYRCFGAERIWDLELVGGEGTEAQRDHNGILCDNANAELHWGYAASSTLRVHWHLHVKAPPATDINSCPDSCNSDWTIDTFAASTK